jgi:sugar diacid utilization regulator
VAPEEPPEESSPTSHEGLGASGLRDQLTKLQGLVALSMVMTDSADASQIARLASSAVPSLSPVRCAGVHVANRGWLESAGPCLRRSVRTAVEKQLRALHGQAGPIRVEGERWAWALPMRSLEGAFGHVVIAGEAPVQDTEQFLLRVLAQQLGIAIANADIHARERATAEEIGIVNLRLERSLAIHDRLTEAAVKGRGMVGVAETVYELTGYPVVIEDSRGNLLASAGARQPHPEEKERDRLGEFVQLARNHPAPVRLGDRLSAASGQPGETFAVLSLVDPDGAAGEEERIALEHGATVLALELSRFQSVLEAESRLGADLLDELLEGTDDERARMRTQLLGYDLGDQQRVAIVDYPSTVPQDRVFHAVRQAAQNVGARPLLGSRREAVVALSEASLSWTSLRSAIDAELGHVVCRIGIGGICQRAPDVPRSYREAQLVLELMAYGASGASVAFFDELGVFQILAEAQDPNTVHRFVRRWLGALLDYDGSRNTDLVHTLATYLEAGGNYAQSARVLHVHRNTLRYRLKRITDIAGHDLGEPDVQFNLQLATRAWRTLAALRLLGTVTARDNPTAVSARVWGHDVPADVS